MAQPDCPQGPTPAVYENAGDQERGHYPDTEGPLLQITSEVMQDKDDANKFEVSGKDKSWFLQKGGILFKSGDASDFILDITFEGGNLNRFGDDYADLSRNEQQATINWLLMAGVAPAGARLTGCTDCKAGGFYFLLHLNYRRTAWRVLCCPHNAEVEDGQGQLYTSDPQRSDHFEFPAEEGQVLGVAYVARELWLMDRGVRVARGRWNHGGGPAEAAALPSGVYRPAVLTPNCPTRFRAAARAASDTVRAIDVAVR